MRDTRLHPLMVADGVLLHSAFCILALVLVMLLMRLSRLVPLLLLIVASVTAQTNTPSLAQKILLPDGPKVERTEDRERNAAIKKAQREESLKADHADNVKDAVRIQELAREIEQELREAGYNTVSANSVKKSDEIEKLVKTIKRRLRRPGA